MGVITVIGGMIIITCLVYTCFFSFLERGLGVKEGIKEGMAVAVCLSPWRIPWGWKHVPLHSGRDFSVFNVATPTVF